MKQLSPQYQARLHEITDAVKDNIFSSKEILAYIYEGLSYYFDEANITVYLLQQPSSVIEHICPEKGYWPLPKKEKRWILQRIKQKKGAVAETDAIWLKKRSEEPHVDKKQMEVDRHIYHSDCEEGLYFILVSEEHDVLGIVFIHQWASDTPLSKMSHFKLKMHQAAQFLTKLSTALENFIIHQKMEQLINDKKRLTQRIQKDEQNLKRRLLELQTLYEISSTLESSLDHSSGISKMMELLNTVIPYDIGTIYMSEFMPGGEVMSFINANVSKSNVAQVQENCVLSTLPFRKNIPDLARIKKHPGAISDTKDRKPLAYASVANVPLIFKDHLLGMISFVGSKKQTYDGNAMRFLHTMSNQFASHLGRLKLIKELEKSKIESMINSMDEGVILFNEKQELEIINPSAIAILELKDTPLTSLNVTACLKKWGVLTYLQRSIKEKKSQKDIEVSRPDSRSLLVNISPVQEDPLHPRGTAIVLRDTTQIHKLSRIKSHRLDIISRINTIVGAVTEIESLLPKIMAFILNVSGTNMGSILLQSNQGLTTRIHSNFPDKVLNDYQLCNGQTISDHVIQTKKIVFIDNYTENPMVKRNAKVLLDYYLGIPILVNDELIGVINIAQKYGKTKTQVTQDDIHSLEAITAIVATALYSATLYQKTLKSQQVAHELEVARLIQTQVLPAAMPQVEGVEFFAMSRSTQGLGGDYYDIFRIDDHHMGIIVADIVGKGIQAGLDMAMLKSLIHTSISSVKSPKKALEKLNAHLYKRDLIKKFVPLFYCIYNIRKRSLKYCNAGHEPGILLSGEKFSSIDTVGLPIGSVEKIQFQEKEMHLQTHDIVVLCTDGVAKAKNAKGKNFGYMAIKKGIKESRDLPVKQIVQHIQSLITAHIGTQLDDVTVCAFKVAPKQDVENPVRIEKFRVKSSRQNIKYIRDKIGAISTEMGFDSETVYNIRLAVNEAQANMIEHSYGGHDNGDIVVQVARFQDRVDISLRDFAPESKPVPSRYQADFDELEGSGFGVFLMQELMDKIEYFHHEKSGMEVKIVKYLPKIKE
jgi:phosphoserine phosphatase RsbU/P